ncbi:MAG: GNAT family N-acetyltransferase [Planctomycetota bacterium]
MSAPKGPRGLVGEQLEVALRRGPEVLPLLREVWGDARDVPREYPLLFEEDGAANAFVTLSVGAEPASTCGYLERDLVTPFGELRVALLGSVATRPAWRGRGLAGHVLAAAESVARERGCVAVLLWPMDGRVYRGSGYRPAACEWNVLLPTDLELGAAVEVRSATPADADELLALYDRHPVRVRRTAAEFAQLLGCPDMDARVAIERGRAVAYACRGRGGDLATCVHEWAGRTDAVLGLVSLFAREVTGAGDARYLLAPDWASEVTEALLDAGCLATTRPLGMAKLADRAAACRYLEQRTGRELVPTACGALVQTDDGPRGLTDAQLLAAVRPPENRGAGLEAAAEALGASPEDLPAYAFCWGLDSI